MLCYETGRLCPRFLGVLYFVRNFCPKFSEMKIFLCEIFGLKIKLLQLNRPKFLGINVHTFSVAIKLSFNEVLIKFLFIN